MVNIEAKSSGPVWQKGLTMGGFWTTEAHADGLRHALHKIAYSAGSLEVSQNIRIHFSYD